MSILAQNTILRRYKPKLKISLKNLNTFIKVSNYHHYLSKNVIYDIVNSLNLIKEISNHQQYKYNSISVYIYLVIHKLEIK